MENQDTSFSSNTNITDIQTLSKDAVGLSDGDYVKGAGIALGAFLTIATAAGIDISVIDFEDTKENLIALLSESGKQS